jgi:hypothetical protein
MTTNPTTLTLWRPCGPAELELVRESGWTAWPPRLPEQPIFYPVLNEDYATRIARDWNAPRDGVGYVARFELDRTFAERYPVQQAGGETILELWVPAEELQDFNRHIIGPIEVVAEYQAADAPKSLALKTRPI